jgi:hypothetical protein
MDIICVVLLERATIFWGELLIVFSSHGKPLLMARTMAMLNEMFVGFFEFQNIKVLSHSNFPLTPKPRRFARLFIPRCNKLTASFACSYGPWWGSHVAQWPLGPGTRGSFETKTLMSAQKETKTTSKDSGVDAATVPTGPTKMLAWV